MDTLSAYPTPALPHPLDVCAPFDFRLTLRFLQGFSPAAGEQGIADELRKATRLNGQTVGFAVRRDGPGLSCELHPQQALSADETRAVLARIRHFLGLDDELKAFYALASGDPPFQQVVRALHGFHQPKFMTPFEIACWAVLTQRLPLPQARRIKQALMRRHGGDWNGLPAFPEPGDLAALTEADFLQLTGHERKAKALAAVTRAFQGVTTEALLAAPLAEVDGWLRGIYGIGEWSALAVLIRGLGRMERVEVSREDTYTRELLRAARPVYGELTPEQLWTIARGYGGFQGHWGTYLRSFAGLGMQAA